MAKAQQPPAYPPSLRLPEEVIEYIRSVFAEVNRRTSTRLSAMPTVHEQELDMCFIEAVQDHGRPTQIADDWTVRIETHSLGGMRHWPDFRPRWEIADIGVLVMVRSGGRLRVTKAAGLQSKRLYPLEQEHDEDEPADYQIGLARLYRDERAIPPLFASRTFSLETSSRYRALEIPSPQYGRIGQHQEAGNVSVYYMFYNPIDVPTTVTLPATPGSRPSGEMSVGARIVPYGTVAQAFGRDEDQPAYSPSYADLLETLPAPFQDEKHQGGWRLESFIADEVLRCREGYRTTDLRDRTLETLFYRRSGPIAAAFAITIDAPDGVDVHE